MNDVARGSAALFWAQVAGNAGLFAAIVLITRALGASGRGAVAFVTVASVAAAAVARVGVGEATTIFAARRPELRPALLANTVGSAAVTSGVLALGACGALLLVPEARPGGVGPPEALLLGAGMVASALADAGYMFVLGSSRFRFHAAVTVVSAWVYALAVAVVWAAAGLTVVRALGIWIAVQALKAAVLLGDSLRREGPARPDLALLRRSIAFGARAWLGSLAGAANDRLDQILIAFIATQTTLGIYAVAVNAFEILLYLPGGAATALLPLLAGAAAPSRPERALGALRSVALVTLGAMAAGALVAPALLPLVFGAEFEVSVAPFLWLLPGAIGFAAMTIFSSALMSSGAPGRSSAGPVAAVIVTVVLDLLLIPRHGASGAAVAASAASIVGGLVALFLYRRREPFGWAQLFVPRRSDLDLLRALGAPLARAVQPRGGRSSSASR